jgi:hypothetical protein
MAVGVEALGLVTDASYLVEAAGEVAAAQVGVGVAGYFAGNHALHELESGHFEAENGGGASEMQQSGSFDGRLG